MDEFYLFLPSNVKSSSSSNTTTSYITQLRNKIILQGDYEVGLTEVSFPFSWPNIYEDYVIKLYVYHKGEIKKVTAVLTEGRFSTRESLIDEINKTIILALVDLKNEIPLQEMEPYLPKLYPDPNNENQLIIRWGVNSSNTTMVFARFPRDLSEVLGFDYEKIKKFVLERLKHYDENYKNNLENSEITDEAKYYKCDRDIDMRGGIDKIYVYCNLVKSSLVGDSEFQLLRQLYINEGQVFGRALTFRFQQPFYIPLLFKTIEYIEITFRDGNGRLIKFYFGKSNCVLHCR